MGSENPSVQDPSNLIAGINGEAATKKIRFDTNNKKDSTDHPTYVGSHTQGYAGYRGTVYRYHIFPYSHLAGRYGYIYIASDETDPGTDKSKYAFTLQVPAAGHEIQFRTVADKYATYDPHFNHPGGIQVIGHYLVVPLIPFHTMNPADFYDAAITYIYDLRSLDGDTPTAPPGYKEILRMPRVNGKSLSSVGITRLPNGSFALGLVADKNLDVYVSSQSNDLGTATWEHAAPPGANPNPSRPNQPVNFTATVEPRPHIGTVTFRNNGNVITQCESVGIKPLVSPLRATCVYELPGSASRYAWTGR